MSLFVFSPPEGASPSAPANPSSFKPGTWVDAELVSGPGAEQDRDRLSSMSMELTAAAAVSPSDSSRLGMEKEAESENSCCSSEPPAVTTEELSSRSRSRSKPADTSEQRQLQSFQRNTVKPSVRRSDPDAAPALTSHLSLLLHPSCDSAELTEILLLWWPESRSRFQTTAMMTLAVWAWLRHPRPRPPLWQEEGRWRRCCSGHPPGSLSHSQSLLCFRQEKTLGLGRVQAAMSWTPSSAHQKTAGMSQLERSISLGIAVLWCLRRTAGEKRPRRPKHGRPQSLRITQTGQSRSHQTSTVSFCSSSSQTVWPRGKLSVSATAPSQHWLLPASPADRKWLINTVIQQKRVSSVSNTRPQM